MKQFLFVISILALAWTVQSADAKEYTCTIITGYGTAVGKGSTQRQAKQIAREVCGGALIDMHIRKYNKIDDDRIDDLVLACVNLECEK